MFIPPMYNPTEPWSPDSAEKRRKDEEQTRELHRRLLTGRKKPWHMIDGAYEAQPASSAKRRSAFFLQCLIGSLLILIGAGLTWLDSWNLIRGNAILLLIGTSLIILGLCLICLPVDFENKNYHF